MGFQVLVTAKGCPYEAATLMLKGGTGLRYINEEILKQISGRKEVEKVTPMLMQVIFDPNKGQNGGLAAYLGVDPETFPSMKPFLKFVQGTWFSKDDAYSAVLGYEVAELEQREVGDYLLIPEKNIKLKIVGVLQRSGGQDDGTIFVPLKTVQSIFGKQKMLTGAGVKVIKGIDIGKFEETLYSLPDVQVVSMIQVRDTIMNLVSTAKIFVISIAVIAVLIAIIGVINTILMSVFERFEEIGILKSIGAMPSDIFKLIWLETLVMCSIGGLIGMIMAFLTSRLTEFLIRNWLPYAPSGELLQIDLPLVVLTAIILLFVGGISGIYPAFLASRVRPIETIRKACE